MEKRRVAVTGMGIISALGHNCRDFWQALSAGCSGIAPLESVDRSQLRFFQGAEVRDFDPLNHFSSKQVDFLDRFCQFAVVAAREAVQEAGIDWTEDLRQRTAIVTGSCLGGKLTEDAGYAQLYRNGRTRCSPLTILRVMGNAPASQISMEMGITGPAFSLTTACASSAHALGLAYWLVRQGMVELALAGGSEAPFSLGNLKAWEAMRVVSPDTCRPFDKNRRGLILGEGAAMLVLEPREAALARGAKIQGEIFGFGMSADAHHLTEPAIEGTSLAMLKALSDAGLEERQIGYINAHGSGTPANDSNEVAAIRKVFGPWAERLAISSTKGAHGHTLGAAGAMEAVATVLALSEGLLPPTVNFNIPDPACNLDVIPHVARQQWVEFALSNSFAFGGLNAVLAFGRGIL